MIDMIPEKQARRPFVLGVLNGALFRLSAVFVDPNTVLALLIATITGSNALVGGVAAVAYLGPVLPKVFVAGRIPGIKNKMRYYHMSFAVRAPTLILMTVVVATFPNSPLVVSSLIIVLYLIFTSGGGFAYIPFMEVVSDTIKPSQRSTFFALRAFFGLLLGVLGGYAVKVILSSPEKYPFPTNYVTLLSLGTIFAVMALTSWSFVKDPAIEWRRERTSLGDTLRKARRIIGEDRVYRRYIAFRAMISLASVSGPFYILHASIGLDLGIGVAGLLIMSMTTGGLVSNLFWGRLGDRKGTRILMVAGAMLLGCVPGSALLSNLWQTQAAAMTTFAIMGLANAGIDIALTNYLLDHSEPESRPVYMAFTQIVVSAFAVAPIAGGFLAESFGYEPLFAISLAASAAAAILSLRLPEPRKVAEERFRTRVRAT
jgi:MFS family permease